MKRIDDRPMPATPGIKAGRAEFWRVFSVLSVTMALEGVIWQAVMFGSALVFETRFQATSVLWLGLATSMIYVISGFAQYGLGRRIIDRYPLKHTYVIASALQVVAMLGLALGNGYVALAGAIFSAVLSAAAGPVENILIARYTPSRYHGLGFGAKFVVAFGASPLAILLIARVRESTGNLDLLFLGLAGTVDRDHRRRAAAAGRAQHAVRRGRAAACRVATTWSPSPPCRPAATGSGRATRRPWGRA